MWLATFWFIDLRSQWAYLIINDKFYFLSVFGHISDAAHGDNNQPLPASTLTHSTLTHPYHYSLCPTTTPSHPYPLLPCTHPTIDPSPFLHLLTHCHIDKCTNLHWPLLCVCSANESRTYGLIFYIMTTVFNSKLHGSVSYLDTYFRGVTLLYWMKILLLMEYNNGTLLTLIVIDITFCTVYYIMIYVLNLFLQGSDHIYHNWLLHFRTSLMTG